MVLSELRGHLLKMRAERRPSAASFSLQWECVCQVIELLQLCMSMNDCKSMVMIWGLQMDFSKNSKIPESHEK